MRYLPATSRNLHTTHSLVSWTFLRAVNWLSQRRLFREKQALLPSWLHPYQQTLALDQEQALWDLAYGNRTVEAIAEACAVEPKTVQRWWGRFYEGLDILLQLVAAWLSTFDTFATWVRHPGHTPRERAQTAFGLLRKLHVLQESPPGMGLLALVLQRQPRLFLPCRREAHA